ncbi:MAG: hypothetical protein M1831_001110 [Alyxoria varia]|nr:MAG: hypothetical protein M1831_001110 [Alyxoria varia]
MAFLFNRNRQKGNAELCRSCKELLQKINSEEGAPARVEEELTRNLQQMKLTLQGTPEAEASPQAAHQLIEYLSSEDILWPLAASIPRLPFESRKDAQVIFSNVFRFRTPSHTRSSIDISPTNTKNPGSNNNGAQQQEGDPIILQHIVNERPDIVVALCHGYEHRESAMPCGGVLREALKHDSIAALILYDEPTPDGRSHGLVGIDPNKPASGKGVFWKFFDWIDKGAFEVSADAFNTFREILTKHKKLVSHYLLTNTPHFLQTYHSMLIQSPSYVTKRQSIKLLGELLLERTNYTLMTRYVESGPNLKLCMNLLRDDRRMVNYEAFHIFKVFVANPNKSDEVKKILGMNRERLLRFLPGFLEERQAGDVQFADEKAYCIRIIEALPPVGPSSSMGATGGAGTPAQPGGGPGSGGQQHAAGSSGSKDQGRGAIAT